MNLLHKLQDPQLVADCQHYFGVRRVTESLKTQTSKRYYERSGRAKLDDNSYCKQREFSADSSCGGGELMDRFLGQSSNGRVGGGAKSGRKSLARHQNKTHARQDSSASVTSLGSDGEGGKGEWRAVT